MMTEQDENLIELCRTFAQKADELERKAFNDGDYKDTGFEADFNALFEAYATGKMNRTASGLNFRDPPRYDKVQAATRTKVEHNSKMRITVYFLHDPKPGSIRFILANRKDGWKLTKFETFIGLGGHGKHEGQELWRAHKL